MNRMAINSGGAGLGAGDTSASQCIGAGYASYIFNPNCWGQSYEAWRQQFYGTPAITLPPASGPSAPANLITPGSELPGDAGQQATGAVDQVTGSALASTQADIVASNPPVADACQNFTNSWPYPFGNLDCPTVMLWGVGIAAALYILPKVLK